MDPHAVLGEPGQRLGRRMAVVVVRADRDQGHAGAGGGQEARIGVGTAVVRHLEDVGPDVDSAVQDPRFGLRPEVAGEQDADAAHGDAGEDGQIVGLRRRHGDLGRRGEELHGRGAEVQLHSRQHGSALGVAAPGQLVDPGGPGVGRGQGSGGDHSHRAVGERPGQAAGVVGVQVGQEHQWQGVDPQPAQAVVDRPDIGPGVDEHPLATAGRDHEGVALTDVARDHERLRRRPCPDQVTQRPPDGDDRDHGGEREEAQPGEAPHGRPHAGRYQGEEKGHPGPCRQSHDAVRNAGSMHRDGDQPPHRPPGQPHQAVTQCGEQRDGECRQQAEDRCRRDGRGGQEVRGQRHQGHLRGDGGDQRRGRDAVRRADGQRLGHQGRNPVATKRPGPAGCEQHDRRGRRDGQREPGIGRQTRVHEQEHGHGGAQRRHSGSRASGGEREQPHRPHDRRTQHARLRPGQRHEPGEGHRGHPRLHPAVDRAPA